MTDQDAVAPGWYPDPSGAPLNRWWDGQRWTPQTQVWVARPATGYAEDPSRRHRRGTVITVAAIVIILAVLVVAALAANSAGERKGRNEVDQSSLPGLRSPPHQTAELPHTYYPPS